MNVLIRLHHGYGMGDAVKISAVLRHVVKLYPHWKIDFQAESGRQVVGRGIVKDIFTYGDPYPSYHYDAEVQILLYNTWMNWNDRPNTHVAKCLHEQFGLEWNEESSRYKIFVRPERMQLARTNIRQLLSKFYLDIPIVALHYEGDSAKDYKNLTTWQAENICNSIASRGFIPLLLDWRNKSVLPDIRKIPSMGRSEINHLGGDAEINCAVIRHCVAFIGIDSGPSKCASATNTPSLVIWTRHHPAQFHDPAPNTTHLVPINYHSLHPVNNDPGVIEWFEKHYNILKYDSDINLQEQVKNWLWRTLQ